MAVQVWTSTAGGFETTPAGSDSASEGDDRIRELKETTGALLDKEHKTRDQINVATQGWHREGSAIAYYEADVPTNRPDGATALDANDAGRLWIDSDDSVLHYYDGSDFKVPSMFKSAAKAADYTVLDVDANAFLVTTADTDRTITLPTVADNAGRVISVKKVDSGTGTVTIDGEGAETIDGATTVVVSAQHGLWRGVCDGVAWYTLQESKLGPDTAVTAATADGVETTGSGTPVLKCEVVEIGDWNMDAVSNLNVAHGMSLASIRTVQVTIRNNTGTVFYPIDFVSAAGVQQGGVRDIDATNVVLNRVAGGAFDSTDFNATLYNRGWITIWYEE